MPEHAEQTIAEMERLWREGEMTAEQIAAKTGTTRNVVLGLAHRRGWPTRTPGRPRTPGATRSGSQGLWRPDCCQWIDGPARGATKCGGPIARPGGAYCAEHQARAYRPPSARLKGEVRS